MVGVVLYHAGHLRGGFLGVDLFFVLSGYLITTVLLRSARRSGGIDLRQFWARRARRLLPALIVMLVVVVPVYAVWFATKAELTPLRHDGVASLFYVTNWAQILHGQSYFTATLAESPLRHVWSLAVEEQFYLLWPLAVLVAVRRGGARTVLLMAAFLGVLSAGITIILGATKVASYNSLYLGTHTRAAALLAGAALAAWFRLHGPPKGEATARRLQAAALACVVVLGVMWVTLRVTSPALYVGGLAVSAIAGTILVACAATSPDGLLTRVLSIAPLRFLGTISYGIYLWSWPITQMVSVRHTSLDGWTLVLVQVL
ncbi:MAG TPA: acyltransferase, partial [Acidimicrobiales bacterium]